MTGILAEGKVVWRTPPTPIPGDRLGRVLCVHFQIGTLFFYTDKVSEERRDAVPCWRHAEHTGQSRPTM